MIIRMEDHKAARKSHPLWMRWSQLKKRGLLCQAWESFSVFVRDIGERPEGAKKLRRLDEAAPYGPGNCEWVKTPTREDNLAYFRAWNRANPNARREKHFQEKYGISVAGYEAMFAAQGGVCAICGQAESRFMKRSTQQRRMLCVDHDHGTGEVRGLLCGDCNVGLGAFSDDPLKLDMARAYLVRNRRKASA
jgi:hypothetical protein